MRRLQRFLLCAAILGGSVANVTIAANVTIPANVTIAASTAQARDDADIERWLARHAERAQGDEVAALRQRAVGDLDGDGRMDTVVLYTVRPRAGGRGESRYLAAFKRQRSGLAYQGHVLVSGPGAGEANRVTVLNRAAVVNMLVYAPGDAGCCPTRPAVRRYRLTAKGLMLIRPERSERSESGAASR